MKNYIFKLLICYTFSFLGQQEGPVLPNKLVTPQDVVEQFIKKRSYTWIDGQWKIDGNKYVWIDGHWVPKRIGYHYINGKWIKKDNGWAWLDGYWEPISIKKWKTLYS